MAGKINRMIEAIINERAANNPMLAKMIKAKFMLKGLNPDKLASHPDDDPHMLARFESVVRDLKLSC